MEYRSRDVTPSTRRASDPHHRHVHAQPKYAPPPRRHTDGASLHKVHSRPEDYQNRPRPDKLFEYICFDGAGHPQECDEVEEQSRQQQKPLDRVESNSSQHTSNSEPVDSSEYDGDSEDELTLPACYHHDIAHRGNEYDSWGKHSRNQRQQDHYHHHDRPRQEPRFDDSHHYRPRRCDHSSSSPSDDEEARTPRSRHDSSNKSEHEKDLIAQVARHLRSHKAAYKKNHTTAEVVSELLSEVVRKVSDGGLEDGNLMKDVLREVQHAL